MVGIARAKSLELDLELGLELDEVERDRIACRLLGAITRGVRTSRARVGGLLQFRFAACVFEGLIRDVAIFDSGGEPRGEPGGDGERDARGCDRGAGVYRPRTVAAAAGVWARRPDAD